MIFFRNSNSKNNVSWLLSSKSNQFAFVSVPSYADYTWWPCSFSNQGLDAFPKNQETTCLM